MGSPPNLMPERYKSSAIKRCRWDTSFALSIQRLNFPYARMLQHVFLAEGRCSIQQGRLCLTPNHWFPLLSMKHRPNPLNPGKFFFKN
eukprot:s1171_g5.t1